MLNIFTEIFNYIFRRLQNNSCNKITFKDIGFHFMLQQQIFQDIIKAQRSIYPLRIYGLFCVGIYPQIIMFLSVSIRFPKQFARHNTHIIHSLHLQTNEPFSIHFHCITCFICFICLLTSSEATRQ